MVHEPTMLTCLTYKHGHTVPIVLVVDVERESFFRPLMGRIVK